MKYLVQKVTGYDFGARTEVDDELIATYDNREDADKRAEQFCLDARATNTPQKYEMAVVAEQED